MSQRLFCFLFIVILLFLFHTENVTCWHILNEIISSEFTFGFNHSAHGFKHSSQHRINRSEYGFNHLEHEFNNSIHGFNEPFQHQIQIKEYSELNYGHLLSVMDTISVIAICVPAIFYNPLLKHGHHQSNILEDVLKPFSKRNLDQKLSFLRDFAEIPVQKVWTFPSSLGNYLSKSETTRKEDCMNFEWGRYESFKNFPMDSPARPMRLASSGFFYTGSKDTVKCFACHLEYTGWQDADDPNTVHKRLSPNCDFMSGTNHSNVPIHSISESFSRNNDYQTDGAIGGLGYMESGHVGTQHSSSQTVTRDDNAGSTSTRPVSHKHPDYERMQTRLDSYKGWKNVEVNVEPMTLASAGFFFVGVSDCVRCFSCGGGLRNWEYGDSPWIEHARWFPWCRFLIEKKGHEFVRQHREGEPDTDDELPTEKIVTGEEALQTLAENRQLIEDTFCRSQTDQVEFKRSFIDDVNDKLNEMGLSFTLEQIQQEISRVEDISQEMLMTELVITNMVNNAENFDNQESLDDDNLEERNTSAEHDSASEIHEDKDTETGSVIGDPQILQEENTKLKSQLLCKICMDSDSNIVFIPCGHMVSCENCAPHIRKCAVCRKLIKGRVKAFMT